MIQTEKNEGLLEGRKESNVDMDSDTNAQILLVLSIFQ